MKKPVNESQLACQTARAIIETMLHRTSRAILENDFDAMNACFAMPLLLVTQETELIIRSDDAHRALFDRLVEGYQSKEKTNLMIFRIEALEKKELILPHCPTTAFVIFLL